MSLRDHSDQNIEEKEANMCTGGYIKLFRKFTDWEWYTDTNTMRVFLHLLLTANYTDKRWRGIDVKTGQLITSRDYLAKELGLSTQEVRTALKKLILTNEITSESTSQYTIITICNYEHYQDTDNNYQPAEQPAAQQLSNQRATSEQPASNHNLRRKEINNNIIIVPQQDCVTETPDIKLTPRMMKRPTLEEVEAYIAEKNYNVNAESFIAFYESNGWKVGKNPMKNWKAAVTTWQTKNNNNGKNERRGSGATAQSAKEYSTTF